MKEFLLVTLKCMENSFLTNLWNNNKDSNKTKISLINNQKISNKISNKLNNKKIKYPVVANLNTDTLTEISTLENGWMGADMEGVNAYTELVSSMMENGWMIYNMVKELSNNQELLMLVHLLMVRKMEMEKLRGMVKDRLMMVNGKITIIMEKVSGLLKMAKLDKGISKTVKDKNG